MKANIVIILSLMLLPSWAQDAQTTEIATILGKVYTGVKIKAVEPDGLRIMHSSGAAKLPFSELSSDLQARYNYDPEKANAFERERQLAERQRLLAAQALRAAAMKKREEYELKQESTAQKFTPATAMDVRNSWLKKLSTPPSSLSKDYHKRLKENSEAKASIQSGKLDDEARKMALEYNVSQLTKRGRLDEAANYQTQLIELEKAIAQKEAATATVKETEMLNRYLNIIESW